MKKKKFQSYKLKINKGDNVIVISGNYVGKQGRVLSIDKDRNRAIVEGVNILTKHSKPTQQNPDGGIIKKEGTIHLSNLMIIDAQGNTTRIGRRIDESSGKLIRYSKKSDENIKYVKP